MFCLKGVQKETNKSFKVHPAQVHSLYISLQVNKGMDIQKPGKKSLESWKTRYATHSKGSINTTNFHDLSN